MTTTGKTFKWMLWSPGGHFSTAFDNFITSRFRVQLRGIVLELSFEASGTCSQDSAEALAEKYVEALGKCLGMPPHLMTEAEWLKRTTPPFGRMMTISTNREDRNHVASAMREARTAMLTPEDETLRRCYDHLQEAREYMLLHNDEGAHFAAYKAMEALEMAFGGEVKAIAALGETFKVAKTAANSKRHIPEKVQRQPKASMPAVELVAGVIRKYERYLLDRL
jgi:hypothetical protein